MKWTKEYKKEYDRKYSQEYRKKHPEWKRESNKRWRKRTKWKKENSDYQNKYQKKRKQIDPKYKLDNNMRIALWFALRDKKARRRWESLVNYSIDNLIKHLEKQFDDKMTWDNYGSYWTIDHIKPKSLFKYEIPQDPEFQKCWTLKNLQPMEKIDNIKKRNHY